LPKNGQNPKVGNMLINKKSDAKFVGAWSIYFQVENFSPDDFKM